MRSLNTLSTLAMAAALALVSTACSDVRSSTPNVGTPSPTAVGVVTVQPERLDVSTELMGRTTSPLVAEIRPQVGGIIRSRAFTEGQRVQAGQLLYQIDPASYQAAQASAQAAVDKAQATLQSAQLTAQRRSELARIDAVSRQDEQDAQAAVRQAQADLAAAQATLATASINLSRTQLRSPVAGVVDISSVTTGALVSADQATALTTVRQTDPLQVDITQSSADVLRLKRELAGGQLKKLGNDEAEVTLLLEDGSRYAHPARLRFAGVAVNTGTGAVTLRAVVPNPEGLLMPGMVVRALLPTGAADNALLVPQQAVSRDSAGAASVLVVDAKNTVARRSLTLARAVGSRWQVTAGLQAGERVIVEGTQKVKPGDVVQAQAVSASTTVAAAR